MMTIVLSLIVLGFLGTTVSQVTSGQSVVDHIKAEQLALGTFYRYHQVLLEEGTPPTYPLTMTLDDKTFTIQAPTVNPNSPLNNTNRIDIQVDYP
jgi:hypothetical protein